MSFKLRMVKPVKVRDWEGNVLQELRVGDVVEATYDAGHYWVSCPSIYKDEAVRLEDPIDEQFIQLSDN